jgi:hypothetical protein
VSELRIPDAALHAAGRAAAATELSGADIVAIIRAAAPHIVATELRRFSDELLAQRDRLRKSTTATTKHTRMAGLEEAAALARVLADQYERGAS